MSTIDRVTPILARTVTAVAIISVFAAGFAAATFREPRLVAYAAFAAIAGIYSWRVTKEHSPSSTSAPETDDIRPMAA